MRWLGKAEDAGMDLGNLRNDEDLDPLRSDPRFQAMIQRLGLGHSARKVKNKDG
jgi:hypothetical protein